MIIKEKEDAKTEKKQIVIKKDKLSRNKYWDIVRGIGIVSIVIGHSVHPQYSDIRKFVYAYHLVLFYFISAYFYKESEYGNKPISFFIRRLKSLWGRYFIYTTIITLLHNCMCDLGFYNPFIKKYNIIDIIRELFKNAIFNCKEIQSGPLWFVPTLAFALGIYGLIIYFSNKLSMNLLKKNKIKEKEAKQIKIELIIVFAAIIGILGYNITTKYNQLYANLNISLLVIPICVVAYIINLYKENINKILISKKFLILTLFILAFGIIYYLTIVKTNIIDLSSNQAASSAFDFYIISFIGIYFVLVLAKILKNVSVINILLEKAGKYSFCIMATHTIWIKCVDIIYSHIINDTNPFRVSFFIAAYPEKLSIIYTIVGISIPMLICIIGYKIKLYINNKRKKLS